jgi:hypothetical protein
VFITMLDYMFKLDSFLLNKLEFVYKLLDNFFLFQYNKHHDQFLFLFFFIFYTFYKSMVIIAT